MKEYLSRQKFIMVASLSLLAGGALAAPILIENKTFPQSNAAPTPPAATSASQISAPLAAASNAPIPGGYLQPGYFTGTPASAWTSLINQWPIGGTLYPGPIGGTLNFQSPLTGRTPNVVVTGGQPPGGFLSTSPPGGVLGTNIPGRFAFPNNLLPVNTSGVIIAGGAQPGGAQRAGVSPGGAIIAGGSPGGSQTAGASPGGVIIAGGSLGGTQIGGASPGGVIIAGGTPPNTNPPAGQLR